MEYLTFIIVSLDWSVARKDLDFLKAKFKLSVDPVKKGEFLQQLQADVEFFS